LEKEEQILESWIANSQQWIETVENGEIASRGLATNAAIVEAILSRNPTTIIDAGCGEGWLCRALEARGVRTFGVDGSEALIAEAHNQGKGAFVCQSYEDIIAHGLQLAHRYDVIAFNFALFGKDSTSQLLNRLSPHLDAHGVFIIQTLHPEHPAFAGIKSGWCTEDWSAMQRMFTLPYQWYFRRLDDWYKLFAVCNLQVVESQKVIHPETHEPISVIFTVGRSVPAQP